MDYDDFIDAVQRRMDLPAEQDAEVVVMEVVNALAHALPAPECELLSNVLPGPIGVRLAASDAIYDPLIDEHVFIGYLMSEHQTTGYWDRTAGGDDVLASTAAEEIERRARAVLTLIAETIPGEALTIVCDALPAVLGEWFRGEGEPVA
ncbi:MAG: DUF2267 domain-containing protein [Dehalococcoidia bacterium]